MTTPEHNTPDHPEPGGPDANPAPVDQSAGAEQPVAASDEETGALNIAQSEPVQPAPEPEAPIVEPTQASDPTVAVPNPVAAESLRPPAPRPIPEANTAAPQPEPISNGHPPAATPPWQQPASRPPQPPQPQPPQSEPQSNVYGRGLPPSRSLSDMAAKAARKEAAMVKSVGIDGPTRSIARPELIKDMPDLSEMRHPTPVKVDPAPQQPMANTGPFQAVSPTATGPMPTVVPGAEPLRTTVQLRRIDPWSMLKASLAIAVVTFFVWMIAVGLLYIVLDGMGVWDRLNNTFTDMVSDNSSDGLVTAGQVFGYAGLIGIINIVLMTGMATIGSFIYNQCADIVGGVQITLADPD